MNNDGLKCYVTGKSTPQTLHSSYPVMKVIQWKRSRDLRTLAWLGSHECCSLSLLDHHTLSAQDPCPSYIGQRQVMLSFILVSLVCLIILTGLSFLLQVPHSTWWGWHCGQSIWFFQDLDESMKEWDNIEGHRKHSKKQKNKIVTSYLLLYSCLHITKYISIIYTEKQNA